MTDESSSRAGRRGGDRPDGAEPEAGASAVLELARRMIRVPSVNPPGDTTQVAAIVGAKLASAGFEVEYVEDEPGFVSVVGRCEFSPDGPTLLLNGHLDVVPVGDAVDQWQHDPWAASVVDGQLYGRGAVDMKGAVAAGLVAATTVVAERAALRGSLVFTAVADEEQGGTRGTGRLVQRGMLEADGAIVLEPGDGAVVVAHRGLCFAEITTRGRAAHASQPGDGLNAVDLMAEALVTLRSISLTHDPDPLLAGPTVVAGTTIAGGQATNVIPDACGATIDVRTVPGMTRERVQDELTRHLVAAGLDAGRIAVRVLRWRESARTAVQHRVVRVCQEAFADELGRVPAIRGMAAHTDGGWLANDAGIPTVMAFGPGEIAGCHVVDEHIDVSELQSYERIYRGAILRFLSNGALR